MGLWEYSEWDHLGFLLPHSCFTGNLRFSRDKLLSHRCCPYLRVVFFFPPILKRTIQDLRISAWFYFFPPFFPSYISNCLSKVHAQVDKHSLISVSVSKPFSVRGLALFPFCGSHPTPISPSYRLVPFAHAKDCLLFRQLSLVAFEIFWMPGALGGEQLRNVDLDRYYFEAPLTGLLSLGFDSPRGSVYHQSLWTVNPLCHTELYNLKLSHGEWLLQHRISGAKRLTMDSDMW